MRPRFDLLAFDADDTLWENERLYLEVQAKFAGLLARVHSEEWIRERLYQAETRNLEHFGYVVKAFDLAARARRPAAEGASRFLSVKAFGELALFIGTNRSELAGVCGRRLCQRRETL